MLFYFWKGIQTNKQTPYIKYTESDFLHVHIDSFSLLGKIPQVHVFIPKVTVNYTGANGIDIAKWLGWFKIKSIQRRCFTLIRYLHLYPTGRNSLQKEIQYVHV